jgi:hypothetical protein
VAAGLFFLVSGLFIALCLTLSDASFWYLSCALMWTLASVLWFVQPSAAACFSISPVVGVAVFLFKEKGEIASQSPIHEYAISLIFVIAACVFIALAIELDRRIKPVPAMAGLAVVALSIYVDRHFTNQIEIRTYEMNWSANGEVPWGRTEDAAQPLAIWRKVGANDCYDSFDSQELRKLVLSTSRPTVTVQYNVFRTFGRESGFNVRSVDGYLLNEGKQNVHPGWSGGGQIEEEGTGGKSIDCP